MIFRYLPFFLCPLLHKNAYVLVCLDGVWGAWVVSGAVWGCLVVPEVVGGMYHYQICWQKFTTGHDTLLPKSVLGCLDGVWGCLDGVFMVSEGVWGYASTRAIGKTIY